MLVPPRGRIPEIRCCPQLRAATVLEESLKLVAIEPQPNYLASIVNRLDGGGRNDEVLADEHA